uniref:Ammonium transporter AmtB-like domain-containing protein n=1 Tax=Oryza brachyantha TaxID=4533 RepID=J3LSU3_ORYBR
MATEAAPEWLEKGDNAWQLAAATLVGLQSVPGLVVLYGSVVKKKWAVNSAFMALYAFASVLVCWCLWAFRMSFGDELAPFVGRPDLSGLDQAGFLSRQGFAGAYPAATLVFFQFVFAAITLILVAGSLLGRMNFRAWMLFVPLWLTFSYTVGAFSVWSPNGFLFKAGVMDFAGGYVIHLSSGVAGFTAAFWLAGIAFVVALNVAVTSAVCLAVRVAVPLRLSEEQLAAGDDAIHGEDAYAVWGDGETYEQSVHGGHPMTSNPVASKADEMI